MTMTKQILSTTLLLLIGACGASSDINNQAGASVDPSNVVVRVYEPLVAGDCSQLTPVSDAATTTSLMKDGKGSRSDVASLAKDGKGSRYFTPTVCANYVVKVSGVCDGSCDSVLVQLGAEEANVVINENNVFDITYTVDSLDLASLKITAVNLSGILMDETVLVSFH
jgi:hypothetical protein